MNPNTAVKNQKINNFANSSITWKDHLFLWAIFILCIITCYSSFKIISIFLFIALFIVILKSEKDYFWLAFFFIISVAPANFFYESEAYTSLGLPQFAVGPIKISSKEIILIILIYKSLIKKKSSGKIPLKKELKVYIIYSSILIPLSVFMYGGEFLRIIKDLRYLLFYFVLLPLIRLLKNGAQEKFLLLIFPFVLLSFANGLYFYFFDEYIINKIAPGMISHMKLETGEGSRFLTSGSGEHLLLLLILIFSLFFVLKNLKVNKPYKLFIFYATISLLTITMTATRIWFVVFTLIVLFAIILSPKKQKLIPALITLASCFVIFFTSSEKISNQYENSLLRITSIGEIDQEESLSRQSIEDKLSSRWPQFIKAFNINPITGLGSSYYYYKYSPGDDLGNFNLIARGGLIAFVIFIIIWSKYLSVFITINNRLKRRNQFKKIMLFFPGVLISLLIAHFTTHQVFSVVPTSADAVFLMILLAFSFYYAKIALIHNSHYEEVIKEKKKTI